MSWCEDHQGEFVFGFARNTRLRTLVADALAEAARQGEQTQTPARVFRDVLSETVLGSWSQRRRVVAKAGHIDGQENPRSVVTARKADLWPAQKLYEELYCARGNMENRIKEQFTLFAGRVSAETIRANPLRRYLSAMAYVLVCGLRRLGLKTTGLATAQASTIRLR
jgi:hypothetical protein